MGSGNAIFRARPGITLWLVIAALIIICDQLTKIWVGKLLHMGQSIRLTSFLNLVLAYNRGAAFSFLAAASGWQRYLFTGISVIAIIFILYFMRRNAGQKLFCLSFSLVLGGAAGNLIDRLLYGHVVDFIDFYVGRWHWPAFNIADSAITIGVILFLLDEFRRVHKGR
ncbi:MAG: signal peptidase II [Burkholderiaceae bacterium]|jgi:signal peptidase II|nr:signal peptidase II [Burkholderiaceae bacterium]